MRSTLLVTSLLLLAACKPSETDDFSFDSTVDFAVANGAACLELVDCVRSCGSQADPADCDTSCEQQNTTQVENAFMTLFNCAVTQCTSTTSGGTGDADGGTALCSSDTDSSPTCQTCLTNEENSSACAAEHAACVTVPSN